MVYDSRNRLIVLFGRDGQDRGLAHTWVFDVTKQQWRQRKPPVSPHPRCCHAMACLEKSGLVLLVGGHAVADYRQSSRLSRQAWVYDAAKDTWTPVAAQSLRTGARSMVIVPGIATAPAGTVLPRWPVLSCRQPRSDGPVSPGGKARPVHLPSPSHTACPPTSQRKPRESRHDAESVSGRRAPVSRQEMGAGGFEPP